MDDYEVIRRLRLQDTAEMQKKRNLMRDNLDRRMIKKFGALGLKMWNAAIRALMYEED